MCADLSGSRSWVISTETAAIGQASPGLAGSPKKESDPSRFLSPPVTPRCPGHSSQHPTPAVQKASGRPAAPSLAFASEASGHCACRSRCLLGVTSGCSTNSQSHGCGGWTVGVSLPLPLQAETF